MKKYIVSICLCLISLYSYAFSIEMQIINRGKNFKIETQQVLLDDLTSSTHFISPHFVIYEGRSEEPVSFDAPEDLLLKAATTYYHLTKARAFFIDSLQSDYVAQLPLIKIRLDLINDFDEIGHFAHEHKNPQFNNALTIPPGEGLELMGVNAWDHEIWFRPAKEIAFKEVEQMAQLIQQEKQKINGFRKNFHEGNSQRALFSMIGRLRSDSKDSPIFSKGDIISSGSIELFYQAFPLISKVLSPKHFFLETALIPEVIYHEFAHVALSNHLPTTHSKAVIEGLADYFAARIGNHHRIAQKAKQFSNIKGKNGENDLTYTPDLEMASNANYDFVFGLFWDITQKLGFLRTDELLLKACPHLNTSSDIRNDLINALIKSCKSNSNRVHTELLVLYDIAKSRGI